jgi:hypothetical protein
VSFKKIGGGYLKLIIKHKDGVIRKHDIVRLYNVGIMGFIFEYPSGMSHCINFSDVDEYEIVS